jgi:hypothetical protein
MSDEAIVHILRQLDDSTTVGDMFARYKRLAPMSTKNGQVMPVTRVTVDALLITDRLVKFLQDGSGIPDLPPHFYIKYETRDQHAIEVTMTDDVRKFVDTLEKIGCSPREIADILLDGIDSHLSSIANLGGTALAVRLLVTEIRRTTRPNGMPVSHATCLPCSEGRIQVLFKDVADVSALELRGLPLVIAGLDERHPLNLYYQRWISQSELAARRDSIAEEKFEEARQTALRLSSSIGALSVLDFKPHVTFSPDVRKGGLTRFQAERAICQAAGGHGKGIFGVQLQSDPNGNVQFWAPMRLWVCDIDPSNPVCSRAVADQLKTGKLGNSTYARIASKGDISVRTVPIDSAARGGGRPLASNELNVEQTEEVLLRHLMADSSKGVLLPIQDVQGQLIIWADAPGSGEKATELCSLGDLLMPDDGTCDIRSIFPADKAQPARGALFAVIMDLQERGSIAMYDHNVEGRFAYIIYHAYRDPRAAAPPRA